MIQQEATKKYYLLMYADESDIPDAPEEMQPAAPAWWALFKDADKAEILLSCRRFAPVASATTVPIMNGKTLITNGPFVEIHEHLGGYWLFDCKDLDEAISWAEKIPTEKYGSIETWQLWGRNNKEGCQPSSTSKRISAQVLCRCLIGSQVNTMSER